MKASVTDIKWQNKIRIANYILEKKYTSRQKLAADLGFSLPTVVQNVKELIDYGVLCDIGEFDSTGGRKAKVLVVKPGFCNAVGVEITKNDVRCVMVDVDDTVVAFERKHFPYENTPAYYAQFGEIVREFAEKNKTGCPIAGVGISLPGVVLPEMGLLQTSYGLQVSNISLRSFSQNFPFDYCFERDATSAARSELSADVQDMVYIFLGSTVGGALYLNGRFFHGDFHRAGGFGHSIIVPNGKPCLCGKHGCTAAYCSTGALLDDFDISLEVFFDRVGHKESTCVQIWEEYLDKLAIAITNLRMEFDCNIVIGGEIAKFLSPYMKQLELRMQQYNFFDLDTSYLSLGHHHENAAAIGAAKK